MTHHYPDLNSDFDGLKHIFSQLLRNKNQIWVLKCHQYEIYVLMACFLRLCGIITIKKARNNKFELRKN